MHHQALVPRWPADGATRPSQTPARGTARALAAPAGAAVAAFVVAWLVAHGALTPALALTVGPIAIWWIVASPGRGLLTAIAVLLALPYYVVHVPLVVAALGAIGLLAGTARPRLMFPDLAVGGLVAWLILRWILDPVTTLSPHDFLIATLPFGAYAWTRLAVTSQLRLRVLWVILLAGTAGALSVLYEWATGSVAFSDPSRYQWAGPGALLRAGGIFGGSPAAGISLSMVVLLALPLARGRSRHLARACIAVLMLAIVVTYARAAWIGLAAGLLVLLAILLPRRRWSTAGLVAAFVVLGAFLVVLAPWRSDVSTVTQTRAFRDGVIRPGSAYGRLNFLALSLPRAADTPEHLLVGRGVDAFTNSSSFDANVATMPTVIRYGGPHNDYLRAVLEEGLLGLLLLLAWTLGSLIIGLRVLRRLPRATEQRRSLAGMIAALACYIVASNWHDLSHNGPNLTMAAIVTGLLVSTAATATREGPRRG